MHLGKTIAWDLKMKLGIWKTYPLAITAFCRENSERTVQTYKKVLVKYQILFLLLCAAVNCWEGRTGLRTTLGKLLRTEQQISQQQNRRSEKYMLHKTIYLDLKQKLLDSF
jgi:hypothetical protein